MKHIQKQKLYLVTLWIAWVVLTGSILVSEMRLSDSTNTTHYAAPDAEITTDLSVLRGCEDNNWADFKTQSYRSEWQWDDYLWAFWHFTSAFTQGELGCWTNSLSTALYGQKSMINRFLQELGNIEKKNWKNASFDYVRETAKVLQEEARKKNMRQWQWLDCYWGDADWMLCRKLTMIDWLEAFLPKAVNTVKWWANTWYWSDDIYNHEGKSTDEVLIERAVSDPRSNGLEFIDNTINLSIPLNSPERWTSRRKQKSFREFVMKKFNAYDAEFYLATVGWNQDYRINNAASNPVLENWKTLYVNYKEWLLTDKKLKPYTSKLQIMQTENMQWALPWTNEPIGDTSDNTLPEGEEWEIIALPAYPAPEGEEWEIIALPAYPTPEDEEWEIIALPAYPSENTEDTSNTELPETTVPRAWEEEKTPEVIPGVIAPEKTNPISKPITVVPAKPVNKDDQESKKNDEEENKIVSPEKPIRPTPPIKEETTTPPVEDKEQKEDNQRYKLQTPTLILLPTTNSVLLPAYMTHTNSFYTQPTPSEITPTRTLRY